MSGDFEGRLSGAEFSHCDTHSGGQEGPRYRFVTSSMSGAGARRSQASSTREGAPLESDAPRAVAVAALGPGSWASIDGLVKRPELNGQAGEILWFEADAGRYTVQLENETVKLKPSNLYSLPASFVNVLKHASGEAYADITSGHASRKQAWPSMGPPSRVARGVDGTPTAVKETAMLPSPVPESQHAPQSRTIPKQNKGRRRRSHVESAPGPVGVLQHARDLSAGESEDETVEEVEEEVVADERTREVPSPAPAPPCPPHPSSHHTTPHHTTTNRTVT